jgi:flagellar basal-body rod protein FlgF
MTVGMYASASGMLAESFRHSAISNNLANVSTVGFKKDTAVMRTEPTQLLHRINDQLFSIGGVTSDAAPLIGGRGQGAVVEAILPQFAQGSLMETSNPTDLTIQGEGFFTVDTTRGRRYTRAGNFALDGRGRLVTQNGDPVLLSSGAQINIGRKRFEVMRDGTVLLDSEPAGRLGIVMPDSLDLMFKEGDSQFDAAPGVRFAQAPAAEVIQAHLERANVTAVKEMAEMLEALRSYEMNQRAITAQDETLNTLISQVGRFG